MNISALNVVLQITMVAGLSSIVFLLVMPTIKVFNKSKLSADSKSVLEIADSTSANQLLTIARANKLLLDNSKALIEVVAVRNGISLLSIESPHRDKISALMEKGVMFTICQHSVKQHEKKTSRAFDTLPGVRIEQDGHVYAEGLKDNGYIDELA